MKTNFTKAATLLAMLAGVGLTAAMAQEQAPAPEAAPPRDAAPAAATVAAAAEGEGARIDLANGLPHIRIDRDAGLVEIDGTVVLREADWLELLVCSPGSREHESILTSPARPSHIHLALLTLGAQAGNPMRWHMAENNEPVVTKPAGAPIRITVAYEKDGQTVEAPATQWIVDQNTKQPMPERNWLFAGSVFEEYEGRKVYLADLAGNIVSLVHFGDDLLTRDTEMTHQTDEATWGPATQIIPPLGTAVKIRLHLVRQEKQEQEAQLERPARPRE